MRQMAELLLAPGCAVAVLNNDLHLHVMPLGLNESLGYIRQYQLLNSHFDAVLSYISALNESCSRSSCATQSRAVTDSDCYYSDSTSRQLMPLGTINLSQSI